MAHNPWDASSEIARVKNIFQPIEPHRFYGTHHPQPPEPPATVTSDIAKRPRSASTENANAQNTKKSKTESREKENKPPVKANSKKVPAAAAKAALAAAAIENDEVFASSRWSDAEKSKLFEWFLGANSDEQDQRFERHKTNPGRVYSKVLLLSIYFSTF